MKTKQVKTKKTTARKPRKTTASLKQKQEKLSSMKVLDGKVDDHEDIRNLEKMLNPKGVYNPFKASTSEDFEKKMADMSLPELQSMAVETGVFPSGNRTTLKNKLKKEFKNRTFLGKGKVITSTGPITDVNGMTDEQKKLFSPL